LKTCFFKRKCEIKGKIIQVEEKGQKIFLHLENIKNLKYCSIKAQREDFLYRWKKKVKKFFYIFDKKHLFGEKLVKT